MKDRRVTRMATIIMLLTVAYTIYMPLSILWWLVPFAFGDPDQWVSLAFVDAEVIPLWTRGLYFAVWMTTIVGGLLSLLAALKVLNIYRRGAYFSEDAFRWIMRLGVLIVAAMLADTLVGATSTAILTMHNSVGQREVALYIDNGDISLALCGLGFCMIGWVLKIAIGMKAENESFV
ncbi:MAG: DUF2975 domain-containing protein [Pseudomonadota bacterium]